MGRETEHPTARYCHRNGPSPALTLQNASRIPATPATLASPLRSAGFHRQPQLSLSVDHINQ